MISVKQIVYETLIFLEQSTEMDGKIETQRVLICYQLQTQFEKDEDDVEVEASYTQQQNMLMAYLVAYNLMHTKAIQNIAGSQGGQAEASGALKSTQADVVKAEFFEVNGKNSLVLSAKETIDHINKLVCQLANQMGVSLLICDQCEPEIQPFIIVDY